MSLASFLEASYAVFRGLFAVLGVSSGVLGATGVLLGASSGHPGGLLEASGTLLGASWGHLGGHRSKQMRAFN